jgi:hypothetical protein
MHPNAIFRSQIFLFLALAGVSVCAPSARAARLLTVTFEVNGEVVVQTYYDDGGRADAATVWRYLGRPPIMVDDKSIRVEAEASRPLNATLEGDVRVRIQHGEGMIAQVNVSSLTLYREDPRTQQWHLPVSEVERTAGIAGLGPPTPPAALGASPVRLLVLAGLAILVLLGIAFIVILVTAAGRARTEEE